MHSLANGSQRFTTVGATVGATVAGGVTSRGLTARPPELREFFTRSLFICAIGTR